MPNEKTITSEERLHYSISEKSWTGCNRTTDRVVNTWMVTLFDCNTRAIHLYPHQIDVYHEFQQSNLK